MENKIQIFNNEEFGQARTIDDGGKPLFCGADVAKALGYTRPNDAVNDHCRSTLKRRIPHPQSKDKEIEVSFITEGDVYRLIMKSKLPSAERFESWVMDDVLPSIRKHGIYATEDLTDKAINDPDWMIELLTSYKKERKRIESESNNRSCPNAIPVSVIAKDYGKTAQWFNKKLDELGIQHKIGGTWLLNKLYADNGYTKTQTLTYKDEFEENKVNVLTKWAQKGRMFLYEALRDANILPLCETEYSI